MAYLFHQDDLPKLVSVAPGRERIFFVSPELSGSDAMLAGIIRYKKGAASPYHFHENCEHFYFFLEGAGTVETEEGEGPSLRGRSFSSPPVKNTASAPRRIPPTSSARSRTCSRPPSSRAPRTISAGRRWTARSGFRAKGGGS